MGRGGCVRDGERIAELTTELRELKGEAKANERELERNRGAVANMGDKNRDQSSRIP